MTSTPSSPGARHHNSDAVQRDTPLRRTRGDLLATAVIAAVSLVAIGGVVYTAPIRAVEHTTAVDAVSIDSLAVIPTQLNEVFRVPDAQIPGVYRPLVSDSGYVMATNGHTLVAYDNSGAEVFSYGRSDREICSLGRAWGDIVVTFRSGVGCGDVVSINGTTGEYSATRSALNDDDPVAINSNDRVGTVGDTRVELWRSDLVRTVEYGDVTAQQEPDLQPHPDCTITSALTRTELLAVTEVCPNASDQTMLRLQSATPEESRSPEISGDVALDTAEARLIGIGQDSAAVYVPGEQPTIQSYSKEGALLSSQRVEPAPVFDEASNDDASGVIAPATADLPHHMTFFDGTRLYLLSPSDLHPTLIIEDVLGTGVAVEDRLLVPVANGIAVINWDTGERDAVIPVDRGDYTGAVYLAVAGGIVVEKRGDEIVGLSPAE